MKFAHLGFSLPEVCRLGIATRGNTRLEPEDLMYALDRGVNYWNWCAHPDGMSAAVKHLDGKTREKIVLAMQFDARTKDEAKKQLEWSLAELGTDWVDVVTLYYVESQDEWNEIIGPNGAMEYLDEAKEQGLIRMIGVTSHQRSLAASWLESGHLDMLMIRYNAAHRGAEEEVFPVTSRLKAPVVAFTCLRWGALLRPTPEDPPGFVVPTAGECYRFVLQNPAVSVALTAPNGRAELEENLSVLDPLEPLTPERYDELVAHGERVRRHAGSFP